MSKATDENNSANTKGKRFPRAAVDYVDALLEIQKIQMTAENRMSASAITLPDRPNAISMLAEGENFIGTGWSTIGKRRDGTAFRWMGRIGTLLLPINLTNGASLSIKGSGYTRKRLLADLSVWVDDMPVTINISRKGFNRWILAGDIPSITPKAYHILRIESTGLARLAVGMDSYFSVAVSSVKIDGKE